MTTPIDRHPLYQAAIDADDAYSRVIVEAHGKNATRWNLPYPLDARVNAAYEVKKAADWDWIEFMQAARKVQS